LAENQQLFVAIVLQFGGKILAFCYTLFWAYPKILLYATKNDENFGFTPLR